MSPELLLQAMQGLFLVFMLACTALGIVGLIWAVFEVALRLWYRGVAAHTIYDAVLHVQRAERESLVKSFGTPRDG